MLRWRIDRFLEDNRLDVARVVERSGLSTNTVYPLARGDVRRIDLTTLERLLDALADLTGTPVAIADILSYASWRGADAVEALALEAARGTPTSAGTGRPAGAGLRSGADVGGAVAEIRAGRAPTPPPTEPSEEDDGAWLERLLG